MGNSNNTSKNKYEILANKLISDYNETNFNNFINHAQKEKSMDGSIEAKIIFAIFECQKNNAILEYKNYNPFENQICDGLFGSYSHSEKHNKLTENIISYDNFVILMETIEKSITIHDLVFLLKNITVNDKDKTIYLLNLLKRKLENSKETTQKLINEIFEIHLKRYSNCDKNINGNFIAILMEKENDKLIIDIEKLNIMKIFFQKITFAKVYINSYKMNFNSLKRTVDHCNSCKPLFLQLLNMYFGKKFITLDEVFTYACENNDVQIANLFCETMPTTYFIEIQNDTIKGIILGNHF